VAAGGQRLVKAFSYDVAEMARLFQDYWYNPHHFNSAKDLYSDHPQFVSVAGQQLDPCSFSDLVKSIEAFPAT
jgi:hypothetical protein